MLDEAYLAFVAEPWDALPLLSGGNLVLLRSMTKDYALTGLRLGYSLASAEVTERLASFQPDWSVNALAQAAGVAALADAGHDVRGDMRTVCRALRKEAPAGIETAAAKVGARAPDIRLPATQQSLLEAYHIGREADLHRVPGGTPVGHLPPRGGLAALVRAHRAGADTAAADRTATGHGSHSCLEGVSSPGKAAV